METQAPQALFERGFALHRQGDLAAAQALYARALALDPAHHDALHFQGLVELQGGRPQQAADLIAQAIAVDPAPAAPHANRALALARLGQLEAAEAEYATAVALAPDFAQAHLGHGQALHRLGRLAEAATAVEAALRLAPSPGSFVLRGDILREAGRPGEALASYDQALALDAGHAPAHAGRGNIFNDLGDLDSALRSFDRAAALAPASALAHYNRAAVLKKQGRLDDAIAAYDAALVLSPKFAVAHHNRAVCVLQKGELAAGFAEYEWRKACPDFTDPRYRAGEAWTGQDLAGKTLFVYPELYLGDMIQFARYAPLAARRGARVALSAPAQLHALLAGLGPGIELIGQDASPDAFDYQCALMSLPPAFGTTLETVPAAAPYLAAQPDRTRRWRGHIGGQGLKIGVCWQGSTAAYAQPMGRAFPLAALAQIAALPGVRLISLQKHDGLDQLAALPAGMAVETLGEDFDAGPGAFLDTAAAMMACDLVISADTATAHLAGALGVRTLLALPHVCDWRWLERRADSPWYPSMTLFRQPSRGDWASVFAAMRAALPA